ncbi:MAG TPA: CBS domain-containing protein, partial [Candidatus Cybelea sp.]|nr:CBS domain-containing protein [Candidatus Cybelea sp.]
MKVQSILDRKSAGVATLPPDTALARVCLWLRAKDIGAVVVSADGRHLLGLLSERHVIEALAHHGATAMSLKAEDV